MTKNCNDLDRLVRVFIGLALAIMAANGMAGSWAWIGVGVLATAIMGWCPMYNLIGVDTTCKVQAKGEAKAETSTEV